jgi:hypothetical protein
MISIRPSSSLDSSKVELDASAEQRPEPGEVQKPVPLVWIAGVIVVGLVIAIGYVGVRVLTGRAEATPPIVAVPTLLQERPVPPPPIPEEAKPAETISAQPASTAAPAAPIVESQPVPVVESQLAPITERPREDPHQEPTMEQSSLPVGDLTTIVPKPGERYVQISALNTEAARRYVAELRRGPLEPHLAPGPRPSILRVLIGPFSDPVLLQSTKAELQAAGIDCFIRIY